MIHGIAMVHHGKKVDAVVWDTAMNKGEFVAVYASERYKTQAFAGAGSWQSAFIRSLRDSDSFDPSSFPKRSSSFSMRSAYEDSYKYYFEELARYEPEYDEQFYEMCSRCAGDWSVILPLMATDGEAVQLLGKLLDLTHDAMWSYLDDKFGLVRWRENLRRPKVIHHKPSEALRLFGLKYEWAYFMGIFPKFNVVIFLSGDQLRVDAVASAITGDEPIQWQAELMDRFGILEKW
jgi:hypothetical protein